MLVLAQGNTAPPSTVFKSREICQQIVMDQGSFPCTSMACLRGKMEEWSYWVAAKKECIQRCQLSYGISCKYGDVFSKGKNGLMMSLWCQCSGPAPLSICDKKPSGALETLFPKVEFDTMQIARQTCRAYCSNSPSATMEMNQDHCDRNTLTEGTKSPTKFPTKWPTTLRPTKKPTTKPTKRPTTLKPSKTPTGTPTRYPSTIRPTKMPTSFPTRFPTSTYPTSSPDDDDTDKSSPKLRRLFDDDEHMARLTGGKPDIDFDVDLPAEAADEGGDDGVDDDDNSDGYALTRGGGGQERNLAAAAKATKAPFGSYNCKCGSTRTYD